MIPDHDSQGKVETLRTAPFDCLVDPAWQDCVRQLIASSSDPEEWAAWNAVKQSTVRTVYRGDVTIPGGGTENVHLKLFRAVRLSDRARDALTGSRSAREFRNLLEARARGLPSIQPLAAGSLTGSWGSRSFLLTKTEPGQAMPREPLPPADAAAVGKLLRRVHDAGLHARDLHAGNILRRPDGELLLLDLTSASYGEALTDQERGRALAFFCLDLDGNVRDLHAQPLLAAYGASTAVVSSAVKAGRRLRNHAVTAFGRRAFRSCRTTAVEQPSRKPRSYLHIPAEEWWKGARDAFARLDALEPIKSGRRGAVYLLDDIVIKERTAAAARRLFESTYWLKFAGVPTPMPVAVETFRGRGKVATRRLPNVNLQDDLREGLATDEGSLIVCARNFGSAVGRLHSFGLRNRDMKFENLIRDRASQTILTVDLDGVRRQLPGDNRGRSSDLGRLLAAFRHADSPGGETVIRAFLREYVRTCRKLLYPVPHRRHVLAQATSNARAWATAHA
jgi:tRNA A-37 threonylcarbamoyl transferase component Bud32